MNPNREEALFQLALSKPAGKRAAWLDAECDGDAALRARPDRIAALARQANARQLLWDNGAPALDQTGRLSWTDVADQPALFLGLDGDIAHFSSLPPGDVAIDGRAHFGLLGQLNPEDAPIFAAALSLANWHRRHGFCSVCGAPTEPNRGGW